MPLIIPELPKVENLKTLLGKRFVDESIVPEEKWSSYPIENVIFKAQLPSYALILRQSVEKTAITGAFESGMVPIIIDENNIIVRVF